MARGKKTPQKRDVQQWQRTKTVGAVGAATNFKFEEPVLRLFMVYAMTSSDHLILRYFEQQEKRVMSRWCSDSKMAPLHSRLNWLNPKHIQTYHVYHIPNSANRHRIPHRLLIDSGFVHRKCCACQCSALSEGAGNGNGQFCISWPKTWIACIMSNASLNTECKPIWIYGKVQDSWSNKAIIQSLAIY